jgi:glycine cleavage system H protein
MDEQGGARGEFLETTYDKFVFRVKVGILYSRDGFWAKVDGNVATIGVGDFLQRSSGDVAFLESAEPGAEVRQGQELGRIETIKATLGILSPVSGKVIEVNPELGSNACLINEYPYGAGWIYKIELEDLAGDRKTLLDDAGYLELMKGKIAGELRRK